MYRCHYVVVEFTSIAGVPATQVTKAVGWKDSCTRHLFAAELVK